jgi:hypothetical protein
MTTSITSLARAFKSPKPVVSEVPGLSRPESVDDVGILTIGPKRYGFRCYPGNRASLCTRIVRLFTDDGFGGDSYDVSFHGDGPTLCTCPDFIYRRKDERGETCRHIRAVQALELDKPQAAPQVDPFGLPINPADRPCVICDQPLNDGQRYAHEDCAAREMADEMEWADFQRFGNGPRHNAPDLTDDDLPW